MISLRDAAAQCRRRENLSQEQIFALSPQLFDSQIPDSDKIDFLRALTEKGETPQEVFWFASWVQALADTMPVRGQWNGQPILDCCGTGGGGLNIINISTAMMFVLAGAGAPVVKHGNRGLTKKSGSADVLTALGIEIRVDKSRIKELLDQQQAAFVFAPHHNPELAKVQQIRAALAEEGKRTIFNLIAPIANPVMPQARVLGVFKKEHLDFYQQAFDQESEIDQKSEIRYAVIYGETDSGQPLGEASVLGPTLLKNNVGLPESLDLTSYFPPQKHSIEEIAVSSAEDSARRIEAVLHGDDQGLARKMIVANAAIALVIQGTAKDLAAGITLAGNAINSGKAVEKLKSWRAFSS